MAATIPGTIRSVQRKMLEKLKQVGACSPETAVTLEKVEIKRSPIFDILVKQNRVKSTGDGRYYVDCKETL